jgi:hypothetical protein
LLIGAYLRKRFAPATGEETDEEMLATLYASWLPISLHFAWIQKVTPQFARIFSGTGAMPIVRSS